MEEVRPMAKRKKRAKKRTTKRKKSAARKTRKTGKTKARRSRGDPEVARPPH